MATVRIQRRETKTKDDICLDDCPHREGLTSREEDDDDVPYGCHWICNEYGFYLRQIKVEGIDGYPIEKCGECKTRKAK
jgi:hypothetical protein